MSLPTTADTFKQHTASCASRIRFHSATTLKLSENYRARMPWRALSLLPTGRFWFSLSHARELLELCSTPVGLRHKWRPSLEARDRQAASSTCCRTMPLKVYYGPHTICLWTIHQIPPHLNSDSRPFHDLLECRSQHLHEAPRLRNMCPEQELSTIGLLPHRFSALHWGLRSFLETCSDVQPLTNVGHHGIQFMELQRRAPMRAYNHPILQIDRIPIERKS